MSDSLETTLTAPSIEPKKLRVLVTGGDGMLGSDAVDHFRGLGWDVACPVQKELDITYMQHLEKLARRDFGEFDWVLNCAAYTAVDLAESESMKAMKVNGIAAGSLAAVCSQLGWRMLQISTDFVFDGESSEPISEDSLTNPLGAYGRSKLFGEEQVRKQNSQNIVMRTAWLFGPNGKCFPKTMIDAWRAGKTLRVVNDQTGSPTYTIDLSNVISDAMSKGIPGGIYHAVGPDAMTWYDFANLAIGTFREVRGKSEEVTIAPVPTNEYPTAAKRPKYSVLDSSKLQVLGIGPMRGTKEALTDFCQRLKD